MEIINLFASVFLGIMIGVLIVIIYINILDTFLFQRRKLNKIDKAIKPLLSVFAYDLWQPLYDRFTGEITGEDIEFFIIPCGGWPSKEFGKGRFKTYLDTNLLGSSVIPCDCFDQIMKNLKLFKLVKIWIWTNRPEIREEAYLYLDVDGIEKSVYGDNIGHPIPERISLSNNIIQRLPPLVDLGSDNVSPAYKFEIPIDILKNQKFSVKLKWFEKPNIEGIVDIYCFLDGLMRIEENLKDKESKITIF